MQLRENQKAKLGAKLGEKAGEKQGEDQKKNINKLQLEGLVKAGAFDSIFKNRKNLFKNHKLLLFKRFDKSV